VHFSALANERKVRRRDVPGSRQSEPAQRLGNHDHHSGRGQQRRGTSGRRCNATRDALISNRRGRGLAVPAVLAGLINFFVLDGLVVEARPSRPRMCSQQRVCSGWASRPWFSS